MGASNAIAAFDLYAGLVPPTSLLILVRMALTSIDSDEQPYFEQGRETLARVALGRGRHAAISRADLNAVERALEPLRKVGAITTIRPSAVRATGSNAARYRLNLKSCDAPRNSGSVDDLHTDSHTPETGVRHTPRTPKTGGRHRSQDPPRTPENETHAPRKVGRTHPEKRGAKEKEDKREEEVLKSVGTEPVAKVLRFPTGELAVVPPPPADNAATINAAWIDHCAERGVTLPSDVRSRYGKAIKSALDDGITPDLIKRALGQMLDDQQAGWPSSLGRYIVRVQETATPRARPSTTDRRVADALALAEQFDRKEGHA